MSKQKQVDKKTEVTFRTIENYKGSNKVFEELTKAVTAYQKSAQKLAEDGKKMADAFAKIAQTQTNDIGDGIAKFGDIIRQVETKRESLARVLDEELVKNLSRNMKTEAEELAQFESGYKKAREEIGKEIAKLEANSKKAGKGKQVDDLKKTMADLTTKIKEAEVIKSDKLRSILLLERKKYCNFLTLCNTVVTAENEVTSEVSKFGANEQYWKQLSTSTQTLPADAEELIRSENKERTFYQIGGGGDSFSGNDSSYDNNYGDDSYSSGGYNSAPPPPKPYGGTFGRSTSYGGGLGTATALYDFNGEQNGDLAFYAGDVITITVEDTNGWLTGELNGKTGIFPTSYVQRN